MFYLDSFQITSLFKLTCLWNTPWFNLQKTATIPYPGEKIASSTFSDHFPPCPPPFWTLSFYELLKFSSIYLFSEEGTDLKSLLCISLFFPLVAFSFKGTFWRTWLRQMAPFPLNCIASVLPQIPAKAAPWERILVLLVAPLACNIELFLTRSPSFIIHWTEIDQLLC